MHSPKTLINARFTEYNLFMKNHNSYLRHRIAHRNLPQLLLGARERLMSYFKPILNHYGVTEQQWRILRVLDQHGQLEPWEICALCQILSPSMAGVLARMEEAQLVHRDRMPEDLRRVIVRLASKGNQLLQEMAPLVDAQYHQIEQAYGSRKLNNLCQALEDFMDAKTKPLRPVELPPSSRILGDKKSRSR